MTRNPSKTTGRTVTRSARTGRYVAKSAAGRVSSSAAPTATEGNRTADPGDTGLDQLDPATTEARDAAHFRRIVAAKQAVADAHTELRKAVDEAREAGDSWTVIGAALGTSKQNAYQRFGK